MLTKNKNAKVNYVSRLLALPLAAIIFFAFTLKMKKAEVGSLYDGKPITVVIDAGHGGSDAGANEGNIYEKNLNLAIAQQVKELNDNKNIKILLTRSSDQDVALKDRVQFAKDNNADLFISVHIDASAKKNLSQFAGLSITIPKDDNLFLSKSKRLGSAVMDAFKNAYSLSIREELKQQKLNLYVLKENEYPAIIINPANISVDDDLAYITQTKNQKLVAENILKGIENYALNNFIAEETTTSPVSDTIPAMSYKGKKVTGLEVKSKAKNIKVTEPVIEVKYADGTKEMITKEEADKRGFILPPPPPAPPTPVKAPNPPTPPVPPTPPTLATIKNLPSNALYILNGKEVDKETIERMDPSNIASISVLKENNAVTLYGEKGRQGVIEIITKEVNGKQYVNVYPPDSSLKIRTIVGSKNPNNASNNETAVPSKDPERVFTKVEQPATFPGGAAKWTQYIQKAIMENITDFGDEDYGTCIVKFIVDENGNVSNVEATTMKGTHLARTAVNAIQRGPDWVPATQNGHKVNAYTLQPVTLSKPKATGENIPGKMLDKMQQTTGASQPNRVFTKVELEAAFPGGPAKWAQYIQTKISENIKDFGDQDYGTCVVKFIVNEEGKVSEVEATTMKGTNLARVAVDAIRKGPNWVPAVQNGHKVNAYRLQPVTLTKPAKEITSKLFPETN